ncbi:4-hydroxy-tetrahydrodipicolinate reductase [Falsirhodobacter algicola]|uniref:4-hydroxy-tetrahydrodipicolinate reductase n=1 Tax=Falsirhodobacter algicola TaxID=2692330 RepID=A0A8J8SL27_9RHOB|nr:4-hydroxy-tetrahydrodipicolinate reductase [Falsirhodobacter algicola]QUS35996.1 4-hydroxy-tetrahydrodipicolinate reductase [Falsirhodobacter algicola]
MGELPGMVVTGAAGRMGRLLIEAVLASDKARLAGCVVRPGHAWVGQDVGVAMGAAPVGCIATDDPLEAFARAQGILDFTTPDASVEFAALAAQARAVHVCGSTGFEAHHLARLEAAARHAVIVKSGNTSLGLNLLLGLTRRVAAALDADWDIEIVEAHHRMKVDAPSGAALMLGEAAAEGRGVSLDEMRDSGRDGITGVRRRGAIGFSSIRGGSIVGEHDVIFAGEGERISLGHIAADRGIFARGGLKAALWGQDKKPGIYSMLDVLGL